MIKGLTCEWNDFGSGCVESSGERTCPDFYEKHTCEARGCKWTDDN